MAILFQVLQILKPESKIAVNWFKNNHIIVNPGKFQAIIFDKHKGNHTNQIININQKEIKAVAKVKLLGIEIDDIKFQTPYQHHL